MTGGKQLLLLLLAGQAKGLRLSLFLHWRIELLIFGERYREFGPRDLLILYLFLQRPSSWAEVNPQQVFHTDSVLLFF